MATVEEVQQLTGLGSVTLESVLDLSATLTDKEGHFDYSAFKKLLTEIRLHTHTLLSETEQLRLPAVEDWLYKTLVASGDGITSLAELMTGLSIFVGKVSSEMEESSISELKREKAILLFSLYDYNSTGFISQQELADCSAVTIRVMCALNPEYTKDVGDVIELARQSSEDVFHSNENKLVCGMLPLHAFLGWILNGYSSEEVLETKTMGQIKKEAKSGCNIKSMRMLGQMYSKGIGKPFDLVQAFGWFSKAVEKGDLVSKIDLATCYKDGLGVLQDTNKAERLLQEVLREASNITHRARAGLADMATETADPQYADFCDKHGDTMAKLLQQLWWNCEESKRRTAVGLLNVQEFISCPQQSRRLMAVRLSLELGLLGVLRRVVDTHGEADCYDGALQKIMSAIEGVFPEGVPDELLDAGAQLLPVILEVH